jgi:hypothetical protein
VPICVFVFTDIEGSTRRWAQAPEAAVLAARQLLGEHRYEQVRERGADVSDADLADLVRREIDAALEEPDMARGAE